MSVYLLDTNVLSELARPRPTVEVTKLIKQIPLQALFISDVVLAEIRFGIEIAKDALRRKNLLEWLQHDVRPSFAGRVLPVTEDIFLRWRWILEASRLEGYTFEAFDGLLAATAMQHGMTMITRDIEPFERAGVPVRNPWQS